MKRLLVLSSLVSLVAALALSQPAVGQEDFGDPTPLLAACRHLTAVGENEGIVVKNCRRLSPEQLNGTRALVHLRLQTSEGPYEFLVEMRKSLWHTVAWR